MRFEDLNQPNGRVVAVPVPQSGRKGRFPSRSNLNELQSTHHQSNFISGSRNRSRQLVTPEWFGNEYNKNMILNVEFKLQVRYFNVESLIDVGSVK